MCHINISDPSHILQQRGVEMNDDLTYDEEPIAIVDSQIRQLRSKQIPMVKVMWRNGGVEEFTWETEREMRQTYPYLFPQ